LDEFAVALLADDAVYRRTPAGQRELTDRHSRLTRLERKFLSAVTGHTPLRSLLDLGLDEPGIAEVIVSLASRGLLKLEEPEPPRKPLRPGPPPKHPQWPADKR
jgi:hypothetical protein